jgi:glutamate racemase
VAHQVEHVLGASGLENPREQGEGRYSFLCTGETEAFRSLGTRFLQLPLSDVQPLTLGDRELVGDRS